MRVGRLYVSLQALTEDFQSCYVAQHVASVTVTLVSCTILAIRVFILSVILSLFSFLMGNPQFSLTPCRCILHAGLTLST